MCTSVPSSALKRPLWWPWSRGPQSLVQSGGRCTLQTLVSPEPAGCLGWPPECALRTCMRGDFGSRMQESPHFKLLTSSQRFPEPAARGGDGNVCKQPPSAARMHVCMQLPSGKHTVPPRPPHWNLLPDPSHRPPPEHVKAHLRSARVL